MLNFVYECLHVYVCAMSVPGPYKGRKRLWMPWNWSDRWLPTTTGKPQVPCSGDSAGIAEDRLSPGCITMVFVILVQLFALGFRLDWFSEVQKATSLCYCVFINWCSQGSLERTLAPSYHTFMKLEKDTLTGQILYCRNKVWWHHSLPLGKDKTLFFGGHSPVLETQFGTQGHTLPQGFLATCVLCVVR